MNEIKDHNFKKSVNYHVEKDSREKKEICDVCTADLQKHQGKPN